MFGEDGDLPMDGTEAVDKLGRDLEHVQGRLEDDPDEVLQTRLLVEVDYAGLPFSRPFS
jgi:hypothetical protein